MTKGSPFTASITTLSAPLVNSCVLGLKNQPSLSKTSRVTVPWRPLALHLPSSPVGPKTCGGIFGPYNVSSTPATGIPRPSCTTPERLYSLLPPSHPASSRERSSTTAMLDRLFTKNHPLPFVEVS